MPSLDSIIFDTSGLKLFDEEDGRRRWLTAENDTVCLSLDNSPPDFPVDVLSVDELRTWASQDCVVSGYGLIEADVLELDGCAALRNVLKEAQNPSGMTYIGWLQIPFRDFCFHMMAYCMERGMTGLRNTMVLNEKLATGEVSPDREKGIMRGWAQHPYDPTITQGIIGDLSEAQEYDVRFPDHPLSRLRRILNHIQGTLKLDDLRTQAPYKFTTQQTPPKPWWKVW